MNITRNSDSWKYQTEIAVNIISRAVRSGKLLTEYREWDNLDWEVKASAIRNQTCDRCNSTAAYALTHVHTMYGLQLECQKCTAFEECNYCKEVGKLK